MLSRDDGQNKISLDFMTGIHLYEMRKLRKENWHCFFNEMPIREDFEEQWEWYLNMCQDDSQQIFGIFVGGVDDSPESRIFAGCVGYKDVNRRVQKAEFGNLVIVPEFHGKEVASVGCALMLQFMFDQMNLQRAYLEVMSDNTHAINLYERLGFVKEGVKRWDAYSFGEFRDVVIMSILREEKGAIDEILGKLG